MTIRPTIFIPPLPARRPPRWRGKILGLACLGLAAFAANANDSPGTRRVEAQGVSLTVTPLSPDQKTAFFIARGFTADEIAPYARTCGFSFVFENRERPLLTTHLAKWKAEADGRIVHFLPPSIFDRDWEQQGIDKSARIAFLWVQFPSEQEFARGDWIMGMANLMERPEGKFRIVARFNEGGKIVELPVDDVACAPLD
ncbi:MAG: hypothetical protein HY777_12450 [Betaproteobacteria bacterium]|nr:hypothetical protein [Betaproteobacteria bacterium]